MSRKLLKIKYKENFTLTTSSSSKEYLATISKTLYVCIRARETISYSSFSLYMPVMEMLLHTVTIEIALEIRVLHLDIFNNSLARAKLRED
jgi:hypothetical protein